MLNCNVLRVCVGRFINTKFYKMKRPEIIGWEVTTNKNGIKMATLPRDTMEEIVKYIAYADQALRIHNVVWRSEQLSNEVLETAIAKAKPNMDKINDVDEWLDSIR